MIDFTVLFTPILAAVAYSIVIFGKKHLNPENPQRFEPIKFVSTVLLGVCLGIVSVYMQIPVDQTNIDQMFLLYGGSVVLIESILKGIWRATLGRPADVLYE